MEIMSSFETLVTVYQTMQHHIQEVHNNENYCFSILKIKIGNTNILRVKILRHFVLQDAVHKDSIL